MSAEFSGIPLWLGAMDAAVLRVLRSATGREAAAYRLVNAYTLYSAKGPSAYRTVLTGQGTNFIDGKPLALLMRRLNEDQGTEQVRGPDLFERCLDTGRAAGVRHFFFGATPETLEALRERMVAKYPGLDVVGVHAPAFGPFSAADHETFARVLHAADPDVVWVGLGTPRQDIEAARLTRTLGVTTVAVGAAFDFSAGNKPAAPALFRALGLEWTFRLISEPGRLWRRYLFGNTYFLGAALRHVLRFRSAARPERDPGHRPPVEQVAVVRLRSIPQVDAEEPGHPTFRRAPGEG